MLISKNKFFKGMALVLAVLMILPAVLACTDEAAQQSISEIKDSMLSEQDVKDIVAAAIAANPGVSADDIKDIVKDATKDLASAADVDKAVDSAVKDAVKDLPSKSDVDAAIKDAVGKIEADNKTEAEGDAALVAKITEVKAKIEVLKEAYANKKADFSTATYAEIVTLISTASSTVATAKTVEEAEGIYTKLESDLAAFASYALALYTKWAALNGAIVAGKTDADTDSKADVVAYQNLVKEAVAHYYQLNRNTDYAELKQYVYGYDNNGTALKIDLVKAAGYFGDIVAGSIVSFDSTSTATIYTVGTKTYTSLANQYLVAFKAAAAEAAKDVDKLIDAIKLVSLADDSQAKITAARAAHTALFTRFEVNGKLAAADATAKVTKIATLTAAETRTIALRSAAAALAYIIVDGKPLTTAYAEFAAKGLDKDAIKKVFSDEEAAKATAIFTAIEAWAKPNDLWKAPANDSSKDEEYTHINYFFPEFHKQYWNYHMLTYTPSKVANATKVSNAVSGSDYKKQGTNSAYQIIKLAVQEIAAINAEVIDDVTKIDADMRDKISTLVSNIQKAQKFGQYEPKSGGKYKIKENVSMGISNTVNMLKAAVAQLAEDEDVALDLNLIDTNYIGTNATINGITYTGYSTSGNDAGRFLVGFNATVTEYMYQHFSAADAKIKEFKKAVEDLNVTAAVSTEAAINMLVDIEGWKAETKESTGFDYSADVAAAIATLNTKIADINAKITFLKDGHQDEDSDCPSCGKDKDNCKCGYADLKTAIELINKDDDAVQKYEGGKQSSDQRAQTNTLDEKQIDDAWNLYLKFIANGGSNLLAYQKSNASEVNGVQTYNYEVYVDNAKFEALANAKIALDKCTAAADKFTKAIDQLAKLHADLGTLDYTDFDVAKDADKYFLGHNETVKVNGENTIVWVREMTIVEALEAIKAAYAEFKTTNNNEKYGPVEAELAEAAYIASAFAYVKAMAIDTIEATNASAGLVLATIEVIINADCQAEIDTAITHFNTVTGAAVVLSVTMADFGLSATAGDVVEVQPQ